jgi:hypothetical protein
VPPGSVPGGNSSPAVPEQLTAKTDTMAKAKATPGETRCFRRAAPTVGEVPNAEVPNAEVPNAEVPNAEVPNAEVPNAEVPNAKVSI